MWVMSAVTTEAGEKEAESEGERERQEETWLLVTRNVVAVLANDFGCKYLSEQMHFEWSVNKVDFQSIFNTQWWLFRADQLKNAKAPPIASVR